MESASGEAQRACRMWCPTGRTGAWQLGAEGGRVGAGCQVHEGVNAAEVGAEPLSGRVGSSLSGMGYSRCRDRAREWAARGGRGQELRPGVRAASERRRRKGRCP